MDTGSGLKRKMDDGEILVFLPTLLGGGAERVTVNLAVTLARLGRRVHLCSNRPGGPLVAEAATVVRVSDLGADSTWKAVLRLARLIDELRPSSIISALTHANLIAIAASRLAGSPARLILVEHSGAREWKANRDLLSRLFPLITPFSHRLASHVVTVSRDLARELERTLRFPPGRVQVIFNPVITADFFHRAKQPIELPSGWSVADKVIVTAGRLEPVKDHESLLVAFRELRRDIPCRLVILGEGSLGPSLASLAGRLGIAESVHWPGFVPNPLPWIARADLFALTSRWEGLPTALIEAAALNRRLVATDCPYGPREILGLAGHGELVPVGDPPALADALRQSLRSPEPKTRPGFAELFSPDAAARAYLSLCDAPNPALHSAA